MPISFYKTAGPLSNRLGAAPPGPSAPRCRPFPAGAPIHVLRGDEAREAGRDAGKAVAAGFSAPRCPVPPVPATASPRPQRSIAPFHLAFC